MAQLNKKSPLKKRRWFLETHFHDSRYYFQRYTYGLLVSVADDTQQILVVHPLTAEEAKHWNYYDGLTDEILNIPTGEPYKAGDLSERFDHSGQICGWLDRQIICDNLPIDEVYRCFEDDTKLVWSRKDEKRAQTKQPDIAYSNITNEDLDALPARMQQILEWKKLNQKKEKTNGTAPQDNK